MQEKVKKCIIVYLNMDIMLESWPSGFHMYCRDTYSLLGFGIALRYGAEVLSSQIQPVLFTKTMQ